MEELLAFYTMYGLIPFLIAVGGVVLLGVMKKIGLFKKIENESTRHICYVAISVLLSFLGIIIFMACNNSLDVSALFAIGSSVFAINQAAYAIFCTCKSLLVGLLKFFGINPEEQGIEIPYDGTINLSGSVEDEAISFQLDIPLVEIYDMDYVTFKVEKK